MADVVRLQERMSRMPKRAKVWHEAPARVLFFTGVRYERITPASIAADALSRGRRPSTETGKDARR